MNRQLLHLYGSVFVASLGLGMHIYFIPVFAQGLGATFFDLGLIGSASAFAYAITPLLVGYLADRFNRALLFTLGLAANFLATVILVLARSVSDVVLFRLLGGLAYGVFWPSTEVMVADLASADKRVAAMAWYSVAWASGFLIGPSIGGLVVQSLGFIQLFLVSAVIIALAIMPDVVWVVPSYRPKTPTLGHHSGSLSTIRGLMSWYTISMCYGIVFGIIVAIFPGYANSVGVLPTVIGLLFTAFGLSRVIVFAVSERLLRFGERGVLSLASGVAALGALLIAMFPGFVGFLLAMVIIGGGFGVIFPVTIGLISRHFSHERLGIAIGSYETMFGLGFAVGPFMGGAVAALASVSLTFLLASTLGGFMVLLAMLGRTYPSNAPPEV